MDIQSLRVLWVAGRRGEILTLGPVFQHLERKVGLKPTSWFLGTGEDGTAAFQALDFLGLRPDETAALCHPADQPAVRLTILLERVETFMRQRKGQRLIFTGCGPAAAAAALCCHARGNPGLWLKPADPAGLIGRLRWESGLERVIEACAPAIESIELEPMPDLTKLAAVAGKFESYDLCREIPGLRAGAPRIVWAVLRRDWGIFGNTGSNLVRALAGVAAQTPEIDFVILSNLNAMVEKPFASIKDRPANLMITPPLPYPAYMQLMGSASGVVTDSALVAGEAIGLAKPVAALGEGEAEDSAEFESFTPERMISSLGDWVDRAISAPNQEEHRTDAEAWVDRVQGQVSDWLKSL